MRIYPVVKNRAKSLADNGRDHKRRHFRHHRREQTRGNFVRPKQLKDLCEKRSQSQAITGYTAARLCLIK